MPPQPQATNNLTLDASLCFLSAANLGLLIGVTGSFISETLTGDLKSQQLGTVLAFITVAQTCELLDRIWRLASLSLTSTKAQRKGQWRRKDLTIETASKLLIVRDEGEEGATTKLRSEFFPENGGVRLPTPFGTPYEESYYADGEENPGCLFSDNDRQYGDEDGENVANISLQEVSRGEVQLQTAGVLVGPSTAVFDYTDKDSVNAKPAADCHTMALKKKGWVFVDESHPAGMATWGSA